MAKLSYWGFVLPFFCHLLCLLYLNPCLILERSLSLFLPLTYTHFHNYHISPVKAVHVSILGGEILQL